MCRYRGHVCEELKIESILNNTDEYVITGSENGTVSVWEYSVCLENLQAA